MKCIVGLGYVGLPLAVAFGKSEKLYGFDINKKRIDELKRGHDSTGEAKDLECNVVFSDDPSVIKKSDFIIVAVPTPIDDAKRPDLRALKSATNLIGKNLSKGAIVVYESTVYPGCTEEECIPILEKESGLRCGTDFSVGYSPERINPGDSEHSLNNITKIISALDNKTLDRLEEEYSKIVDAGLFKASSIKVAEAAKIIENTQRDINIALMNELKMIFDKMDLDTEEVINAAATKWNFNRFMPGLVGGHCIGVDPYYLAYKAKSLGHNPEMILAGRRINDNMPKYEATKIIKTMSQKNITLKNAKVLIIGASFKPNVPDMRNSKVEDLIHELKTYGCDVFVCEPFIEGDVFGCKNVSHKDFDGFKIMAVPHESLKDAKCDYVLMQ